MIGEFIQTKRREVGLTQAQLAEYLGVSAPAVNKWEKDLCYPDSSLIAPLARLLKTDLNEMFSFYSVLSEKERELIIDDIFMTFIKDGSEEAFEKIEKALHENPRDGYLFKEIADKLYDIYILKKANHPNWHLKEIAEYYERAIELAPDLTDKVAISLMSVYAELGERLKAEETWQKLSDTKYSKNWAHADLLFLLKDYEGALAETKENVINNIIDLYNLLDFLKELFEKNHNPDMAALTYDKRHELAEVFSLWQGIESMSKMRSIATNGFGEEEFLAIKEVIQNTSENDTVSSCPLFEGVILGNRTRDSESSADLLEDFINVAKK